MNLWKKWEKTPSDIIKKDVIDGRDIKSVSSIHRIKKATEVLGEYGKNWGLKEIKHSKYNIGNLVLAELEAIFYISNNDYKIEFEISNSTSITNRGGDGKISFNAQYRKSLETDTINKALSRLGLFADIYADEELIPTSKEIEDEILKVEFVEIGGENGDTSLQDSE